MRIILFILIQFVTILCLFNSIDARSLKRKHKHESRHLKRLLSPVILSEFFFRIFLKFYISLLRKFQEKRRKSPFSNQNSNQFLST